MINFLYLLESFHSPHTQLFTKVNTIKSFCQNIFEQSWRFSRTKCSDKLYWYNNWSISCICIGKFPLATYSQLSSLKASLNSPGKDEVFYLPMSVFHVAVRGLSKCIKVSEKFPVYVETLLGNEILRWEEWTLFGRRSASAIHASYMLPWKNVNHFASIYNVWV